MYELCITFLATAATGLIEPSTYLVSTNLVESAALIRVYDLPFTVTVPKVAILSPFLTVVLVSVTVLPLMS